MQRVHRGDPRLALGGQHHDLVAGAQHSAGHLAGVAAVVVVVLGDRPDDPLDGEADVDEVAIGGDVHVLEVVEQRRALVPGHLRRAPDDVVAVQRRDGDEGQVGGLQPRRPGGELAHDLVEGDLVVVDEIHLVDADHQVGNPQQGGEEGVAAALLGDALAGVDEHDRQLGGGGAGDHVAGVLNVTGTVGDDEAAARGHERAVGDVDRDALLALGPQAVHQQRQVGVVVAALAAGALDGLQLVGHQRLGVEEQPADERALAVVHRPGGGDPQKLRGPPARPPRRPVGGGAGHQKYPSRLRSSIAASVTRSSARVSPRSEMRAPAISAMTASRLWAPETTAPVQVMSPTVR